VESASGKDSKKVGRRKQRVVGEIKGRQKYHFAGKKNKEKGQKSEAHLHNR